MGGCKPCAFAHTKGCENGVNCKFCHLCAPGEKKRRQRRRILAVACQVDARLTDVHQQQQQGAAAAADTGMSPVMCRPMMSSPAMVSRPVMLPSTGNWVASPNACSPGGISSTGSSAWPVGSPTTSHCTNGGTWPAGASPAASNAFGGYSPPTTQLQCQQSFNSGTWPVAASPPASNAVGGWQNPQTHVAAVVNVF